MYVTERERCLTEMLRVGQQDDASTFREAPCTGGSQRLFVLNYFICAINHAPGSSISVCCALLAGAKRAGRRRVSCPAPKDGLAVLQHSLQRFEPTLQAEDLRVLGVELLLKTLDGGQRDTAFVHRRN